MSIVYIDGKPVLPGVDYSGLPEHLREGMRRYIEQGIVTGDFLRACLENNLREAVGRNSEGPEVLVAVCEFLYNEAPGPCHGSMETVRNWIHAHANAHKLDA